MQHNAVLLGSGTRESPVLMILANTCFWTLANTVASAVFAKDSILELIRHNSNPPTCSGNVLDFRCGEFASRYIPINLDLYSQGRIQTHA
jgi:hypothetical protein